MNEIERSIVLATQAGLPLVARPWEAVAAPLGLTEAELLDHVRRMQASGVIRRIAAVPNHYALGYTANGMSVWDVPDEQVEALGERVGALPFVSHCYRRPRRLPQWPYNLFAMVHGKAREQVLAEVAQIREIMGEHCRAHDVLFSTRILKKTGLRLPGG